VADTGPTVAVDAERTAAFDAEPTASCDSEVERQVLATEELPPLRAPGAGNDSGLAAIEAEFQISDDDIALLELGALEFAAPLSPIEAALTDDRAALDTTMQRLTDSLTEQLGTQVRLQPFAMIPERCWEGEHREALVELLGCLPNQTWNILPLAGDAATADALGIIQHPGGASLHAVDAANSFLTDILSKMHQSCAAAAFSADRIDGDALGAARDQARGQIEGLARHMAGVVIGTEAVTDARSRFFGD